MHTHTHTHTHARTHTHTHQQVFGLPVTEKIVLSCKCFLTADDEMSSGHQRMRMLLVPFIYIENTFYCKRTHSIQYT